MERVKEPAPALAVAPLTWLQLGSGSGDERQSWPQARAQGEPIQVGLSSFLGCAPVISHPLGPTEWLKAVFLLTEPPESPF